jgi:ribosomal protein S18 acetylase RimI-like enzyme
VHENADVTIRTATALDADEIARVQVESWRVAYEGIVPDEHLKGLDWREWAITRREQLERAAEDGVRVLVALDDGVLVGYVATGPERDSSPSSPPSGQEIYALYLAPEVWGQGIGHDLLSRAVSEVPVEVPVTLWVLADNLRARAFYERQGFRTDGATTTIQRGGRELAEVRYRLDRPSQVAKPSDR